MQDVPIVGGEHDGKTIRVAPGLWSVALMRLAPGDGFRHSQVTVQIREHTRLGRAIDGRDLPAGTIVVES